MEVLITNVYVFIMAVVLAVLEIQIEGKDGWAKNLPTWRPSESAWSARLFSFLMFQKKLTGYHLAMGTFVLLIFHLPYVFGVHFTLLNWAKTLSLYILFISLWDFLWFILNSHYSLKKFKKKYISWHVVWFLGLPKDYWASLVFSFIVLTPFVLVNRGEIIVQWWIINVVFFILQLFFVYLFTSYLFKKDRFDNFL